MTDLTMLPFFSIFNELTNILNCLTVSTKRFSQQFLYIIQQKEPPAQKQNKQTKTKQKTPPAYVN